MGNLGVVSEISESWAADPVLSSRVPCEGIRMPRAARVNFGEAPRAKCFFGAVKLY